MFVSFNVRDGSLRKVFIRNRFYYHECKYIPEYPAHELWSIT